VVEVPVGVSPESRLRAAGGGGNKEKSEASTHNKGAQRAVEIKREKEEERAVGGEKVDDAGVKERASMMLLFF
jgi:hypothetical protein